MSSAVSKKRGFDDSFQSDDRRLAKRSLIMPEVAGKITCIELVNFMCHSSLTLNFDVNKYNCSYIIGPNGSGKSALFAALNIGLGGAGRSNERGKRINDYIKENEK
uniref:Rad50/SbcC-type AAA domain-containing protein n=1 Tax=Meloidogyne incognita TaxID=6306 RepID=A0A914KH87_MELIC